MENLEQRAEAIARVTNETGAVFTGAYVSGTDSLTLTGGNAETLMTIAGYYEERGAVVDFGTDAETDLTMWVTVNGVTLDLDNYAELEREALDYMQERREERNYIHSIR